MIKSTMAPSCQPRPNTAAMLCLLSGVARRCLFLLSLYILCPEAERRAVVACVVWAALPGQIQAWRSCSCLMGLSSCDQYSLQAPHHPGDRILQCSQGGAAVQVLPRWHRHQVRR